MEQDNFIYTIGHGNRPLQELVEVLLSYDIDYLIDVRSIPYSRYCPQFARESIAQAVNATGRTRYAYLGHQLGGYPQEAQYQRDGKTDYERYAQSERFQRGIARLRKGCCQLGLRLCIMCSESDPTGCHRTRLISNELEKIGVPVRHIVFLPEQGGPEKDTGYESVCSPEREETDVREEAEAMGTTQDLEVCQGKESMQTRDVSRGCATEFPLKSKDFLQEKASSRKGKIQTTLLTHRQVLSGAVRRLKTKGTLEADTYPDGGLFT